MCVGYEMVDGYNHLISNKREWNNCLLKTPKKKRVLPNFFYKNNRFSACF